LGAAIAAAAVAGDAALVTGAGGGTAAALVAAALVSAAGEEGVAAGLSLTAIAVGGVAAMPFLAALETICALDWSIAPSVLGVVGWAASPAGALFDASAPAFPWDAAVSGVKLAMAARGCDTSMTPFAATRMLSVPAIAGSAGAPGVVDPADALALAVPVVPFGAMLALGVEAGDVPFLPCAAAASAVKLCVAAVAADAMTAAVADGATGGCVAGGCVAESAAPTALLSAVVAVSVGGITGAVDVCVVESGARAVSVPD
jgi:hypothetical protein